MAKVAAPGGLLGSVTVQIGGGGGGASLTDGPMVRRKTPSELRVSFQLGRCCAPCFRFLTWKF
jgi:hypothetical protein